MISDIEFFALEGVSKAGRVCPVFRDATQIPAPIHTAERVKHDRDLVRTFKVPYFEGYDSAVMVRMDGEWYWVDDRVTSTNEEESIAFTVSYCPETSILSDAREIGGLWSRFPYKDPTNRLKTNPMGTAMEESRRELFQLMTWTGARDWVYTNPPGAVASATHHLFWVTVTTNKEYYGGMRASPTEGKDYRIKTLNLGVQTDIDKLVTNESSFMQYGFFVDYVDGSNDYENFLQIGWTVDPDSPYEYVDSDNNVIDYRQQICYPRLYDIMCNPDNVVGLPAQDIMDISVSAYCPYAFSIDPVTGVPFLTDADGNPIQPYMVRRTPETAVYIADTGVINDGYIWVGYYELGSPGMAYQGNDSWEAHTLSLSEMEAACGQLVITGADGSEIAEIPTEFAEYDTLSGTYRIPYHARVLGDNTGIYTQIYIDSAPKHIITIPEGKLPWVGDAWFDYMVRERSNDREMLQFTKDQALIGFGASAAESLVTGGMTVAMGRVGAASERTERGRNLATGMSIGGGIISGALNTYMSMQSADKEQEMKERAIKKGPSTGYNTGYGLSYLTNSILSGEGISVRMPKGLTETIYLRHKSFFGYPDERYRTYMFENTDLGMGYIEGTLVTVKDSDNEPVTGMKEDLLASDLLEGRRLLIIE